MQTLSSETQFSNTEHATARSVMLEAVGESLEIDALRYPSVGVQIDGTFTGTVQFEVSNEGDTWLSKTLFSTTGAAATEATAPGMWTAGTGARFFRVRVSALTDGAVGVHAVFSTNPAHRSAPAGQFAGAAIGTAGLNTITTPGVYRQGTAGDATLVRNYPVAAVQGVLEVFHSTATSTIFQRYTQTTGTASGKGHWQRRYTSSAWSAWGFVATQRVDQTAGRAIYTWDDVNNREQLIYGDTGWRELTLENGWTGSIRVRRVGAVIEVIGSNLVAGTNIAIATTGTGFRPHSLISISGRSSTSSLIYGQITSGAGSVQFAIPSVLHAQSFAMTYTTVDTWPTTLPGTAVGSIPA